MAGIETAEPRRRLTREESRTQTRERLIEAAYQLFAAKGVEAASIDEIAEQAGYSRGAFYSNFETKEEIFEAVADREFAKTEQDFDRMEQAGLPPEAILQALRDYALAMTSDRRNCLFFLEMQLYGVRHAGIRDTIARYLRKDTERAARFLDKMFAGFGVKDHPSSELIVSNFIAMAQGLTMRQIVEPSFSDDFIRDALALYFDSVITACIRPR